MLSTPFSLLILLPSTATLRFSSLYVGVPPGTRVRAPVRSVASTPPVSMSRVVSFSDVCLLSHFTPAMEESQDTRNEKEDAVHDAKRKTGFQH